LQLSLGPGKTRQWFGEVLVRARTSKIPGNLDDSELRAAVTVPSESAVGDSFSIA
jgi:hypothetical protein